LVSNVETVAGAVTASVLPSAPDPGPDPHTSFLTDGHSHESHCLNCSADLTGPFCHNCGQHAHVHKTLSAFFHDFAHGVFHLEGKLWNTIPVLVWRPGQLTRRYIDGQRARFVSPIALFLFCVFLMFGVVGLTSNTPNTIKQASLNAAAELRTDQQKLRLLQQQRSTASRHLAATLDDKIKNLESEMTALQEVRDGKLHANLRFGSGFLGGVGERLGGQLNEAAKNPELLFYKLRTNAYKFSWALIPISVPFVWLLFPFSKRFKIYDHIVFVTYSLCFMMLLLAASAALGIFSESLTNLAWFVPPIHMYRQIRGAYSVGQGSAIWRTALLTIFAFIAISLFGSMLVMLGVFQ
jgi:hypothetical protein